VLLPAGQQPTGIGLAGDLHDNNSTEFFAKLGDLLAPGLP